MIKRIQIHNLGVVTLIFLIGIAACTTKSPFEQMETSYDWGIQDSIQINFLGELALLDFEPDQKLFLGRWNAQEEYVVFDESGQIKHSFKLNEDGPNRIGWIQGINFWDGKIWVMEQANGIYVFDLDGGFLENHPNPKNYFYINGLPLGAHRRGDELLYLRPESGESLKDIPSLFSNIYSAEILEIYDLSSSAARTTMPFPPNTVYNSGNFYNWTFPTIIKHRDEWILTLLTEQKDFVYRESEGKVQFVKAVDLALEDAITMPGIPMNRQADWYEEFGNVMFEKIENIYRRDNDVIVIYTKGVSEETAEKYNRENWEEWISFLESIPRYAAIFDDNHELIQKDLSLPKGVRLSSILTGEGAIIAEKNQEYFGVEEDYLIYYELELVGR